MFSLSVRFCKVCEPSRVYTIKRHQRFISELKSKQTLLIARNIDLSPRIFALSLNDKIEFFGEYEWNDKGDVIHWTPHDPQEIHVGGWIFYNSVIYQ